MRGDKGNPAVARTGTKHDQPPHAKVCDSVPGAEAGGPRLWLAADRVPRIFGVSRRREGNEEVRVFDCVEHLLGDVRTEGRRRNVQIDAMRGERLL